MTDILTAEAQRPVMDDNVASLRLPVSPPISRWHFTALLQICEILIAALLLARYFRPPGETAIGPPLPVIADLGTALAVVVLFHCVARLLGGYRFEVIRKIARAGAIGAVAWSVATIPLLCQSQVLSIPDRAPSAWLMIVLDGIVVFPLVRLGFALLAKFLIREGWLGHTVLI